MTSLQSKLKQVPVGAGYYVAVASCNNLVYGNSGTNDVPNFSYDLYNASVNAAKGASTIAVGSVFRDHGLTLVSASRVFRKVQLLEATGSLVNGGTDGVAGAPYGASGLTPYLTGFIELPGTGGYSSGTPSFTPVARLG